MGVGMLTNDDVVSGAKRKDSIARSAWPIELHSGEKPRLEWLLDDYYDIAYDNFVPVKGEGLLVAGRCLSAEHEGATRGGGGAISAHSPVALLRVNEAAVHGPSFRSCMPAPTRRDCRANRAHA